MRVDSLLWVLSFALLKSSQRIVLLLEFLIKAHAPCMSKIQHSFENNRNASRNWLSLLFRVTCEIKQHFWGLDSTGSEVMGLLVYFWSCRKLAAFFFFFFCCCFKPIIQRNLWIQREEKDRLSRISRTVLRRLWRVTYDRLHACFHGNKPSSVPQKITFSSGLMRSVIFHCMWI